MAFNILPTGMSFQRLGNFPLDSSAVYKTFAEAMEYASNNPTAYPGQIVYVEDGRTEGQILNNVEAFEALFMVTADKALKLVVAENDINMDEMVDEVEEQVKDLTDKIEELRQELKEEIKQSQDKNDGIFEDIEQDIENKYDVLEDVFNQHIEDNIAKFEEVEQKFAQIDEAMVSEHKAMREEVKEQISEVSQNMAEMQEAMIAKHAEIEQQMITEHNVMKEESVIRHTEMERKMDEKDQELDDRMKVLETLNLESKPYIDENGMLVLCGNPAVIRPNDEGKVEVAFRFFDNAIDNFVFEPEVFAKTRICMGYGAEGIGTKRNITETTLELYDLDKVFIIDGGSQVTGEIGTVNIIAERCNYIDGIQGARAMNGGERNIVHNFNIKVTDVKLIDTLYGGGNGYSVVWNSNVEVNGDTAINVLSVGGSNGFMKKGHVVLNDGSVKVMQGVNRGVVDKAEMIVNGGIIDNFYIAGEIGETSGVLNQAHVELNDGLIKQFHEGEGFKKAEGHILDCVIENGDVSMLKQFDCIFFGGDSKVSPIVDFSEIKELKGKDRLNVKEFKFVAPVESQRIIIAVPIGNIVEEIQYLEQGCVNYKDMFKETVVLDPESTKEYDVYTYIFAIPCSAKMTFKVVLN